MFTEDCRKTNKATDEDMNLVMDGKIPESKEAKCTMTCTMKQFKMVKNMKMVYFIENSNFWFESNQADEKDGKLELNVPNLVKMAEANGLSQENCTIVEEVGNKCKSPLVADQWVTLPFQLESRIKRTNNSLLVGDETNENELFFLFLDATSWLK